MKRYTIGLTLLFALMNTGCEDAKAESKDYDTEIAELRALIDAMPKTTHYECVFGGDDICIIEIPDFDPNEKFSYSIMFSEVGNFDLWTARTWGKFEKGKYIADKSYDSYNYEGQKIKLTITK